MRFILSQVWADEEKDNHEEEEVEKEDFLFLLEEAYTQKKNELQLTTSFKFLEGASMEKELEDGAIEEKHQNVSAFYQDYGLEFGITDRLEPVPTCKNIRYMLQSWKTGGYLVQESNYTKMHRRKQRHAGGMG